MTVSTGVSVVGSVSGRRTYTEEELQAALRDIQSGKLGTRRAAVIYGIPRSTLRNKVYKLALERDREASLTSAHAHPHESGAPSATTNTTTVTNTTTTTTNASQNASAATPPSQVDEVRFIWGATLFTREMSPFCDEILVLSREGESSKLTISKESFFAVFFWWRGLF